MQKATVVPTLVRFRLIFDACPAYERVEYVPLDTGYGALHSVLTCANLEVKPGLRDASYCGCCRLGDEASRLRWVETMGDACAAVSAVAR